MVYYMVWAEVRHLTKLSLLDVHSIASANPEQHGHLLALQCLVLSEILKPKDLLSTLLPLLPLPSLMNIKNGHIAAGNCCGPAIDVSIVEEEGRDAVPAALCMEALTAIARHLAAAPQLLDQHILIGGPNMLDAPNNLVLTLLPSSKVAESLMHLSGKLVHLTMCFYTWEAACIHALSVALPRLWRLTLLDGTITTAGLAANAKHMSLLRELDLYHMEELSTDAWLGLAAGRAMPLMVRLSHSPAITAQVLSYCRAVQSWEHGEQHITWAAWRLGQGAKGMYYL